MPEELTEERKREIVSEYRSRFEDHCDMYWQDLLFEMEMRFGITEDDADRF